MVLTWNYAIRFAPLAQALRFTHRVNGGENRKGWR